MTELLKAARTSANDFAKVDHQALLKLIEGFETSKIIRDDMIGLLATTITPEITKVSPDLVLMYMLMAAKYGFTIGREYGKAELINETLNKLEG